MPRVGQNPLNSAAAAGYALSERTLQMRRQGQYPAIDPRTTAAAKVSQLREAKSQAIKSGQYFPNNVVQKNVEGNRARVQASLDKIRAIRDQQ